MSRWDLKKQTPRALNSGRAGDAKVRLVGRFYQYLGLLRHLELRSRRFHFNVVYFENLERRIKCNLIFLYVFTILRSKFRTPYTSAPDFRSRRDRNETVYFEVAVRVRGIDRNGQPYERLRFGVGPIPPSTVMHKVMQTYMCRVVFH